MKKRNMNIETALGFRVNPLGSKDSNDRVLGPKHYTINGI